MLPTAPCLSPSWYRVVPIQCQYQLIGVSPETIYNTLGYIQYDSRISPDLPRGTNKLIGGDFDVDDEGFEQRRFEPVQLLHHGFIDYQSVRTRIGLAKKAMSLQANREHKQEQERAISNCR
jgi:hypothetical protein